jgi:hypothetical protein
MQTFLPFENFAASAMVLDNRRLGKQRVECKQIYLALTEKDYGWKSHPAVKMWRGYESTLALYGQYMCEEWILRGFDDSLKPWFAERVAVDNPRPPWLGDEQLHRSHRSNLLRKDVVFYRSYFPFEPRDLPYFWPVK